MLLYALHKDLKKILSSMQHLPFSLFEAESQILKCNTLWMPTGYTKAAASPRSWVSPTSRYWLIDLEERFCCSGCHRGAWTPPPAPCNSKAAFWSSSSFPRAESSRAGALLCMQRCVPGFPVLWGGLLPGPGTPMGASGLGVQAPTAVQQPNWPESGELHLRAAVLLQLWLHWLQTQP